MAWIGVAACLFLAMPAEAQRQVGSDGRALDRNLQVGSAGINSGSRRLPPGSYQDAIITGNVGGLHRFRGDIDYRAPGEFSDRTSADDSYLFRLRSVPPTPRSYQNPAMLPQRAGGPLLLRSGSGVTTGEVSGQAQRLGGSPAYLRRDDLTGLSVRDSRRSAASLDASALPVGAPRRDLSDTAEPGRSLQITATPLTGVRGDLRAAAAVPGQPPRDGARPGSEDGQAATGQRQSASQLAIPPTIVLGERLIYADETLRAQASRSARSQPSSELEDAVLRPLGSTTAEPGEDVYFDLLRRVRGDERHEPQSRGLTADRLGGSAQTQSASHRGARIAGDRLGGSEPRRVEGADEQVAFDQLLKRLRYDLPPLTSLSSGSGTRFDQSMAAAEKLMSEGKYLQAEASYARAMALPRGTPLAAVGYAHAQIGAGLHAVAASNLRRLFTHHPELIAARYAPPVLPRRERVEEIQDELRGLSQSSDRPDIMLLVAYLAYQQGDRDGAEEALAAMSERSPQDRLVPLLRRIWGTGESPQAAETHKPDRPTPEEDGQETDAEQP